MWGAKIYALDNIPSYELEREKKIYELFHLDRFDIYQKNELYNYCSDSQDFTDIADYLCTDIADLREDQHLWLYIPQFMKGVKNLESFEQADVEYIRDQLMKKIIENQVILPTRNVTHLIINK